MTPVTPSPHPTWHTSPVVVNRNQMDFALQPHQIPQPPQPRQMLTLTPQPMPEGHFGMAGGAVLTTSPVPLHNNPPPTKPTLSMSPSSKQQLAVDAADAFLDFTSMEVSNLLAELDSEAM